MEIEIHFDPSSRTTTFYSINWISTCDTSCRIGHAIGINIKLFEGSPNTVTLKHCPIHLLKCDLGRIGYDIHISSIAKHQDTRNWWKSVTRYHFTILNQSFYLGTNLNRVEVSTKECYDIHYINKANFLKYYICSPVWLTNRLESMMLLNLLIMLLAFP